MKKLNVGLKYKHSELNLLDLFDYKIKGTLLRRKICFRLTNNFSLGSLMDSISSFRFKEFE